MHENSYNYQYLEKGTLERTDMCIKTQYNYMNIFKNYNFIPKWNKANFETHGKMRNR